MPLSTKERNEIREQVALLRSQLVAEFKGDPDALIDAVAELYASKVVVFSDLNANNAQGGE